MRKYRMTVIVFVVCGFFMTVPSTAEAEEQQAGHLVPVDKKLTQDVVQHLFERGQQEVYRGQELETIGMPVGGIATGQLYLRGDGTLGLWQIFNKHVFTGYGRDCYRTYRPSAPVDSGFAVITKQDDKVFVRALNKDFETVEFVGMYPIGIVRYSEDKLPVRIALTASSIFIPLNAKDSALPATLFHIVVEYRRRECLQGKPTGRCFGMA